ncbi:MAG: hypothetical protein Q7T57_06285 [Dehalococcoidales bacterium]|nr:hypothetical protein [Dehalococcoidales bacterium]
MPDPLAVLNQACRDMGVCGSTGNMPAAPGVKHAAEFFKDKKVVRVACWEDGCVTSCVAELQHDGKTKEEVCCYTSEDGGEELYRAWAAHLCSPEVGYKEKRVEIA